MLNGSVPNDELFGIIYTVDEGDDWTDPQVLEKANPNIGVSVYREFLLSQQQRAKNNARLANVFKTKHLNIWVSARSAYFNLVSWQSCEDKSLTLEQFEGQPCILAFDLARKLDMNSMARLYTREIDGKTHYYSVAPRFWVPYDTVYSVEKNEDRRTAERFQKWVEMGVLTVTDGAEVDYRYILEEAKDGLRDLERKALQVGTDEDGGYAVPEALDRNILTLLKDEVVMRQEATVITVGGSDYKKLVNLGGTASGWVGETDARSQTATSKLGLIEPFMGEIYGNPQATQKMLDDAFFNVEAWINSELATEFAEQEEIAFTTGDGTKKPKGFLAYESTDETDKVRAFGKLQHIVSGDATAVTADAIIKLIYTLRKAHRTGAKFMMNNNSLFAIRLLKDSEGNYLWRPGLELGQPSSLAGYGIAENEQMPDIAADAKAIAFGNFKRGYTIVDRIGTRILRDPYTNKPFVGFYTTKRTGGMLVDSQAIKLLKIAVA
ncbi:phage major capsid protein [Escherichia coli]